MTDQTLGSRTTISCQCCIAGGGPAGLMLGYLLARAGVEVLVLEKHKDFLRDFRGDTIHPSTLEVLHDLGLIDGLLALPHQALHELYGIFGQERVKLADFRQLAARSPFIAFMPQWDFLNFLARAAAAYPTFKLMMSAEATALAYRDARVVGLQAKTAEGPIKVQADLVVAADGRSSCLRDQSQLPLVDHGAPMDVLWFKLPKGDLTGQQPLGRFTGKQILILIDRGDYWQAGYVISKGGLEALKAAGMASFRSRIAAMAQELTSALAAIEDWSDCNLLTVQVNRLERWSRPGLLCIGDAAHAMSPVGGIGINLAIQDAVATANLLALPLREGRLQTADVEAVQARRLWPARMTQRVQIMIQNRLIAGALEGEEGGIDRPPLFLHLLTRLPLLRRLPGRFVGLGLRPERPAPHLLN